MSSRSSFPERVGRALTPSTNGVLGLVDQLLSLASEHGLQLAWQAGRCRIRSLEDGPDDWIEAPLTKSVIRAALARIAVLCNERNPNSVSPYGGQGELAVGNTLMRVAFTNTPEEQNLELVRIASAEAVNSGTLAAQNSLQPAAHAEPERNVLG
jgi:hypothetical protein